MVFGSQSTQKQFYKEFLQTYKSYPCLWDNQSPTYMRKDLKRKADQALLQKYREIEPDASIHCMKKKLDCFRHSYRRERKKVQKSLKDNDSYEMYTPSLWYYKLMSFLPDTPRLKKSDNEKSVKKIRKTELDSGPEYDVDEVDMDTLAFETTMITYDSASDDQFDSPPPPSPPKKKKKSIKKETYIQEEEPSETIDTHFFNYQSPAEIEDECSAFATNMKIQMRELDMTQKYIAQKLISDIMFLGRTQQLNLKSIVLVNGEKNLK